MVNKKKKASKLAKAGAADKGIAGKAITEKAYEDALVTLRKCCSKHGLFASGGKHGYRGVWSRDSFVAFLGASLVKDKNKCGKKNEADQELFRKAYEKSLGIIGKYQSRKGQIPNAVHSFGRKRPAVDYGSIDSTLWYIIGHYMFKKRYGDSSLFRRHKENIAKALTWLGYQDFGENVMLEQLPTTDWQDAFPQRYGRTINTQALYYRVLSLVGDKKNAKTLKRLVNRSRETALWNGHYYYAYRWKNHNKYKEIGEWFDSLGNLLAIVFGIAGSAFSERILLRIQRKGIHRPYPIMSIHPPITEKSEYWEDYYKDCDAGKPFHYLNGGIWTYIGGFYVLALIKARKMDKARKELRLLAEANLRGNQFPEWINPLTKKTHGIHQAWSAGTYILAYESLKKGRVLL